MYSLGLSVRLVYYIKKLHTCSFIYSLINAVFRVLSQVNFNEKSAGSSPLVIRVHLAQLVHHFFNIHIVNLARRLRDVKVFWVEQCVAYLVIMRWYFLLILFVNKRLLVRCQNRRALLILLVAHHVAQYRVLVYFAIIQLCHWWVHDVRRIIIGLDGLHAHHGRRWLHVRRRLPILIQF